MSTSAPVAPAGAETNPKNVAALPLWQRALAFGTGLGIAIGEHTLEAAIVRARPAGATLLATTTIKDFRNRPAAEWGAALLRFLASARETRLAATVLLPRGEVIVRNLTLPGVSDKDAANAIELQVDTLHPWGDVDIAWGWSRAGKDPAKGEVIIGLAKKETLSLYETLFAEAGIPIAAATFSPAVIHAAIRVWNAAPESVLCFHTDESGHTEVYGESEARALFSAEFSGAPERALAFARAELRMTVDCPAEPLLKTLPATQGNTSSPALPSAALAYAAAIAGSAPHVAKFANLLPPERRASHDRIQFVIPAVLVILVAMGLLATFVIFPAVEKRRYRADLDRETRQLEPAAARAQALERRIKENRTRTVLLDEIKRRPQDDLEVLNELTRILPPQVWTNSIEIYPDSVVISGEADQAAPLLKLLDSSPLFQNSDFALSVTRSTQTEQFRIKTIRRGRAGRTTP
jgi:Tfp pilus assembly protein PilN